MKLYARMYAMYGVYIAVLYRELFGVPILLSASKTIAVFGRNFQLNLKLLAAIKAKFASFLAETIKMAAVVAQDSRALQAARLYGQSYMYMCIAIACTVSRRSRVAVYIQCRTTLSTIQESCVDKFVYLDSAKSSEADIDSAVDARCIGKEATRSAYEDYSV